MTSDFLKQHQERVVTVAQRVLDEGWWLHERSAIDILVVSGHMPLIDAQVQRAAMSGAEAHTNDATMTLGHLSSFAPEERRRFALSPWSTQEILSACAADTDYQVRSAVARNLLTPPDLLSTLWQDADINVRIGVASNVQTPPDLLEEITSALLQDSAAEYALGNAALPQERIKALLDRTDKATAPVFANTSISPTTLFTKGSVAKDDQIALWTAANLAASPDHLQRLAIRCIALLQSEGTSARKWDKQLEILNQIARHPATSDLTLLNLTTISGGSSISELILSVCNRPVVPSTYWAAAAQLGEGVKSKLAAHQNCPVDILEALAVDPSVDVRAAVHSNQAAPEEVRATARLAGV